ncbi:Ribokinase-like protein [Phycomyces nitens]|nr:Ribokinase-like protein [Phycomyces nitens]
MGFLSSKKRSRANLKVDESEASTYSRSSSPTPSNRSFSPNPAIHYRTEHILIVGQIYNDTILHVSHFPAEDTKQRATHTEQRIGGNCTNTCRVLAQFPKTHVWCMSAIGTKESSVGLVSELESSGIKMTTCLYRQSGMPSSYIIHNEASGSRTIISCNSTLEITLDEFIRKIEMAALTKSIQFDFHNTPFTWVHFEGRNISETLLQIRWLETKGQRENWRSKMTISVELEKPDREDIDLLMSNGDVVFFSKIFGQARGFSNPTDFLEAIRPGCKPEATLFCTWGEDGAACIQGTGDAEYVSVTKVDSVVDSVGAGDTFIASAIYCLGQGLSATIALKVACETATQKVSQLGFDNLGGRIGSIAYDKPNTLKPKASNDGRWLSADSYRML